MTEKRQLEALRFKIQSTDSKITISKELDFFTYLKNELDVFIDEIPTNEAKKESVRINKNQAVSQLKSDSHRNWISGKIATTNYGTIVKIVDPENKDADPVYQSKKEHGVEKVFFFFIHLDNASQDGIILLERYKQHGIKQLFSRIIAKFFRDGFIKLRIELNDIIEADLVERFIDHGRAKSITWVKDLKKGDISEGLRSETVEDGDYEIALTIRKKKGYLPNKSKKVLSSIRKSNNKSYLLGDKIDVEAFKDGATAYSMINYGEKVKKINLEESFKLRGVFDIIADIDDYGESDFDLITKEAEELLDQLKPK